MNIVLYRLAKVWRLLWDRRSRSELVTQILQRGRVHQPNSVTLPGRYPALFSAVVRLLHDRPAPRLLSYGCSSGEEVITLRGYFPDAAITGVEINRYLLRQCRRLPDDPGNRFLSVDAFDKEAPTEFDAVFCMAVLTYRPHALDWKDVRDISAIYPFAQFAAQVRRLAATVADGGYLVVEHALYLVEDVAAECGLVPVTDYGHKRAKSARFAPDGLRIEPRPEIARIFRKSATPE